MLSLFLIIADIASGVRLLWILYIHVNLAKLILYIKAKEDQLAFFIVISPLKFKLRDSILIPRNSKNSRVEVRVKCIEYQVKCIKF